MLGAVRTFRHDQVLIRRREEEKEIDEIYEELEANLTQTKIHHMSKNFSVVFGFLLLLLSFDEAFFFIIIIIIIVVLIYHKIHVFCTEILDCCCYNMNVDTTSGGLDTACVPVRHEFLFCAII